MCYNNTMFCFKGAGENEHKDIGLCVLRLSNKKKVLLKLTKKLETFSSTSGLSCWKIASAN